MVAPRDQGRCGLITHVHKQRLTSHTVRRLCDIGGMGDNLIGYARVSTGDQNHDLQHDALTAAGCSRVFTDTASGALDKRPQLDSLPDYLRPGDVLVVWRLDRLGRSVHHLTETVNSLAERGVGFRSLTEGIDTTTPAGKLVFHIFAALAEFEREIIRERTTAGLSATRVRGRKGGWRPKMTPGKLATARQAVVAPTADAAPPAAGSGTARRCHPGRLGTQHRHRPRRRPARAHPGRPHPSNRGMNAPGATRRLATVLRRIADVVS